MKKWCLILLLFTINCYSFNLQEEINNLQGFPGKIEIPSGIFDLGNQSIILSPGQILEGRGPLVTTLTFSGNTNSAVVLSSQCKIKDLKIVGNLCLNGITVTPNSVKWCIDDVSVEGFENNIYLENSYVGIIRDITSKYGRTGIRISKGFQTTTKFEGNNYISNNDWGMVVEGMMNMNITISSTIENNRIGGICIMGETRQISIQNSFFERNGPKETGVDVYVQGNSYAISIENSSFFFTRNNIIVRSAQHGEISKNYIGGKCPILLYGAGKGIDVKNNDMPFGSVGYGN